MLSTIYIFILYIILHIRSHLGSSTQALELQYSVSVHISISIMPPVSADSGVSTLNALCAQSQSQQPKQEHTQYRGVLRRYRDDDDTHVNLPHKLRAKPCPQPLPEPKKRPRNRRNRCPQITGPTFRRRLCLRPRGTVTAVAVQ